MLNKEVKMHRKLLLINPHENLGQKIKRFPRNIRQRDCYGQFNKNLISGGNKLVACCLHAKSFSDAPFALIAILMLWKLRSRRRKKKEKAGGTGIDFGETRKKMGKGQQSFNITARLAGMKERATLWIFGFITLQARFTTWGKVKEFWGN